MVLLGVVLFGVSIGVFGVVCESDGVVWFVFNFGWYDVFF